MIINQPSAMFAQRQSKFNDGCAKNGVSSGMNQPGIG